MIKVDFQTGEFAIGGEDDILCGELALVLDGVEKCLWAGKGVLTEDKAAREAAKAEFLKFVSEVAEMIKNPKSGDMIDKLNDEFMNWYMIQNPSRPHFGMNS